MKTMKPTCLCVAFALAFGLSAFAVPNGGDGAARKHWEQQHAENQAFRKTLAALPLDEAIEAIIKHRENQHKENLAFFAEQKERRITRINSRERLTDEQKAELLSLLEVMHAKKIEFVTELHKDTLEFLKELADDEDMTREALRGKLKEQMEAVRTKVQAFREEQRAEWREKMREIIGKRTKARGKAKQE